MQSQRFMDLALPGIRKLQPYIPGKPVAELEREYGVHNAIKLASNENPLGPGKMALDAARGCLSELARYPDGNGFALKASLAERLGVASNQITLGNGSNDILELMARAFVSPADEVIFSQHAFAVYPIVTQAVGGQAMIALANVWGHDLGAMLNLISERTRLVFIANPNNPTGTWLDGVSLEGFISQLPAHVLVVVDEAYFEYAHYAHKNYPDAMQWITRYPNLIVVRTFSKAYGLAGLRVGYGVSHPDVADILNRVRQPFNLNSMALAAAQGALADDEHLAHSLQVNQEGMLRLTTAFTSMGLEFSPSAGNFVSVDVQREAAPVYEALLYKGVIVRPVASYGMPRHLRVTIGLPAENERFIGALKKVLEKSAK
jgi:histidinol-phosphate aminotransferase